MTTETKYKISKDVLDEISDDVYACASCGYCRFGCPVFQQMGFERITPRGRMIALKRAIEGRGDIPQTIIDSIYTCAQCENCKIQCPLEIDFVKISELLREQQTRYLRHRFDNKNARHHRRTWKMTLEKLLIKTDVLYSFYPSAAFDFNYLIH